MRTQFFLTVIGAVILAGAQSARAAPIMKTFDFTSVEGHSATVEFTYEIGTQVLVLVITEKSDFGDGAGFETADLLLTTVSWDFGLPGAGAGDNSIAGGAAKTSGGSSSVNFSVQNVGDDADVSGEYGYGNADGSMALLNFISGNVGGTTDFGGDNLDGPAEIDGPQAGLISDDNLDLLPSNFGAINDQITVTLTLDSTLADLDFLAQNGVRVEYGSDAKLITVPEPSTMILALLGLGIRGHLRRRRSV